MKPSKSITRSLSAHVGLFLILIVAPFGILPAHVARPGHPLEHSVDRRPGFQAQMDFAYGMGGSTRFI
jgi:hypothetical protein